MGGVEHERNSRSGQRRSRRPGRVVACWQWCPRPDIGDVGLIRRLASGLCRATLPAVAQYTVKFHFDALHRTFSSRTGRTLERAAFLLTCARAATENHGLMPDVEGSVVPVKLQPRPVGEVRDESALWITTNALRDCIEEVSLFLEKTRELCAAVSVFEHGDIPLDRWHEVVASPANSFDRLTFPDKVAFLRQEYGDALLPGTVEHLITLNAARNCLVHRQGVVGERDCKGSGCLTVRWMSAEIHGRDPEGNEFPVVPPQHLVAETQLFLRHGPVERRFLLGERITFSTADLSGIWLTLHFFGAATAENVVKLAKAKGLIIDEPEAPKEGTVPVVE